MFNSPATTDAINKLDGTANLRQALMSLQHMASSIDELGEVVNISDCFVDAHKASYMVEQLTNGVIFTNGKVSVLSGFIPVGVACTEVKHVVEPPSCSWNPLFAGRYFHATIDVPVSVSFHDGELLLELENLGNFARAASTIIPCAHLAVHDKVTTIEYRGSHVPKCEDSSVIVNEMWFGVK